MANTFPVTDSHPNTNSTANSTAEALIRRPHLNQESPKEHKLKVTEGNAHLHVAAFLAQRRRFPVPEFSGTGCVIAAGGRAYLREAFMTVSRIRSAGWEWPIQIWHIGYKELPHDLRRRFESLQVEFVDATLVARRYPPRVLHGWPLKSYAVERCPYRNVLMLDSDSVPVRDPIPLFESPEFLETGAIFWPDIKPCMENQKAFGFIGIKRPDNYTEVESGQMMLDKMRCWRAFELVRWLNDYADFWYRYFHGDKSTFDLAFLRCNQPYLMAPPCAWRSYGIEQRWFDGKPLFEHRLDVKRNPKAFVSEEDRFYGAQFDRFDQVGTLASV